jgi:hypothetical protein
VTPQEIQQLWLYAHERWSNFIIPTDRALRAIKMQAWLDDFEDLEQRHVRGAMVSLGASQFVPALGLLREEALELARMERGMPRCPDLDQAWGEVTAAIRAGGARVRPEFSHPAIAETVTAIGWSSLCGSENQDVARGQFARMYETARRRVMSEINPPAPALQQFHSEAVAALAGGEGHE